MFLDNVFDQINMQDYESDQAVSASFQYSVLLTYSS